MAAPSIRDYIDTAAQKGTAGVSPQSYTVTLPTYSAGDLCIIHLLLNAGNLGSAGAPTGWTQQGGWTSSGSGASLKTATFTRIMDGTEGTTVNFSVGTPFQYNWKAVASSWQNVDATTPVSSVGSNTSGAAAHTATWTLGTITGGFSGEAYWGGQYMTLNSDDGTSYSLIGTLTMQPFGGGTADITTAFAADYDVLDSSGQVAGATSTFRLILVRQAVTPGQGARIWQRL